MPFISRLTMERMDGCVDRCPVDWNMVDGSCMNGSRVDGSRFVSWARVSHTFVFDVSHVAAISSNISVVVDNLNTAIRQGHPVVAGHQSSVGSLVLAKVDSRVLVQNTILKSVGLWGLSVTVRSRVVNGGGVEWGWVVGWSRQLSIGSGQSSDENSSLGKHV